MISTDTSFWQTILAQLEAQGRDTFNQLRLKEAHVISQGQGLLVIGVPSATAQDWLQNRLYAFVSRLVTRTLGREMELEFQVSPRPAEAAHLPEQLQLTDLPQEVRPPDVQTPLVDGSPGHVVAAADYYKGYYEKGGVGFSQVAHPVEYYWLALLGPAFMLWKILDADDARPLKVIGPNYWTPPRKYSYEDMARRLNHQHGRYVSGDTVECDRSRQRRKEGRPIRQQSDCCLSPNFDLLRHTPHPAGKGLICKHWSTGLLEVLRREGLAIVELNDGERKPTLQIWRMPPVLTPAQYARLTAELQDRFDPWLDQYGPLFNIPNRDFWRAIAEPTLAPLMPGWDQGQIADNFEQRPARREFLAGAFPNPNFQGLEEEPEDENQ